MVHTFNPGLHSKFQDSQGFKEKLVLKEKRVFEPFKHEDLAQEKVWMSNSHNKNMINERPLAFLKPRLPFYHLG